MAANAEVLKARSPRYPRISLLTAVGYANQLYRGVHRNSVDSDTAYRVMGFSGKNGASATALGALRQFGLVAGLRGKLKVSDLALRIFEPSDRSEYLEAIQEAAKLPDIFADIHAHFPDGVPPSDDPVRSFLIRTRNFSRSGADDCINSLRASFLELEHENGGNSSLSTGATSVAGPVSPSLIQTIESPEVQKATLELQSSSPSEFVRIPLTKDCTAELRFSGPISDQAVIRLLKYIELMKDVWAE
ncbi:MAG: hypothetical protein JWL66_335 [Sphingomonadales bacterium]|nr:hypothetical protein [Sphingomonadales bacterium]